MLWWALFPTLYFFWPFFYAFFRKFAKPGEKNQNPKISTPGEGFLRQLGPKNRLFAF